MVGKGREGGVVDAEARVGRIAGWPDTLLGGVRTAAGGVRTGTVDAFHAEIAVAILGEAAAPPARLQDRLRDRDRRGHPVGRLRLAGVGRRPLYERFADRGRLGGGERTPWHVRPAADPAYECVGHIPTTRQLVPQCRPARRAGYRLAGELADHLVLLTRR